MTQNRHDRLIRLFELVAREDQHLLAVRERFLGTKKALKPQEVEKLISSDLGIDRLESFGAKFGRMQDTIVDKLMPALLSAAGEPVLAAIDNLGRLERLGLIEDGDKWLQMRQLRNRLVHEYIDNLEHLTTALERASQFTDHMHDDFDAMRQYAIKHLHLQLP
ncbi:hypothetical protein I6N98_06250 [Spongiibacter nanhainus]|uniref:DUF86 domain-containing protein n=1 Tax=Spongiibacter nanhainus TaxID=2794344 RepID=A0A7T4URE4_9GAMM|nr:hypothetical protein [Spongiibacter nanhainus]QQD19447.1 hypothetical protein I6N98_06250 [Spongiibacter nanhainus]